MIARIFGWALHMRAIIGRPASEAIEGKWNRIYKFLGCPRVILQIMNGDTADYYAYLFHYLKKKGIPVPTNV
jgi:hypothetical protein